MRADSETTDDDLKSESRDGQSYHATEGNVPGHVRRVCKVPQQNLRSITDQIPVGSRHSRQCELQFLRSDKGQADTGRVFCQTLPTI